MADPIVPSNPADPAKPGNQTSEFSLTKLVAWLAGGVAVLLPVLVIVSDALSKVQDVFPNVRWLGAIAGVIASLLTILMAVSKYTGGRSDLKVAQVAGAAQVQAAQIAASAPPK